jgi:hypothetical protein
MVSVAEALIPLDDHIAWRHAILVVRFSMGRTSESSWQSECLRDN